MNNNCIVIDSDKIDVLVGRSNDISRCAENGVSQSKRVFSSLQGSSNLSQGVNTLNDNLSIVIDKFNRYKNIIAKQSTSFFEEEKLLSAAVENIKTPKELAVVDNIFESRIEEIKLYKNDDKAINTNSINTPSDFDDSSVITNQVLEDINKGKKENIVHYDESTEIQQEKINNINNEQETNESIYDDSSSINHNQIFNINNNIDTKESNYEDMISLKQERLSNINNNINEIRHEYPSSIFEYDIEKNINTKENDDGDKYDNKS